MDLNPSARRATRRRSSSSSMSALNDSSDPIDVAQLVATLNDLLSSLLIPIPLDTPLDLTPSLLLAVLESILEDRLPISADIRKSRDLQSKVQAMKVFLGVLENDVLGEDVGLSDVDPRKLAQGEWDEVVFVGELLCWLGKKYGIIPVAPPNTRASSSRHQEKQRDASIPQAQQLNSPVDVFARTPSPTTHSTATTTRDSLNSELSMMPSAPPHSDTSILSMLVGSPSLSVLDLFEMHSPPLVEEISRLRRGAVTPPPRSSAQCIHEFEEPSFLNIGHSTSVQGDSEAGMEDPSQSASDFLHYRPSGEEATTPKVARKATPVRYTGWIRQADEDQEIHFFEKNRQRPQAAQLRTPPLLSRSTHSDPDRRDRFDLYAGIASTSTPRRPSTRTPSSHTTPSTPILTRHTSPHERSLALLNERAKLMAELASVRTLTRHTQRASGR